MSGMLLEVQWFVFVFSAFEVSEIILGMWLLLHYLNVPSK